MFWTLKSDNRTFSFEATARDALKRMHNAKAEFKEEFKLYGRHSEGRDFIEITGTELYQNNENETNNSSRAVRKCRIYPAPRKRKKTALETEA